MAAEGYRYLDRVTADLTIDGEFLAAARGEIQEQRVAAGAKRTIKFFF